MRNSGLEVTRIATNLLSEAQRNTNHGSMPERMPAMHEIEALRVQAEKLQGALARMQERVVAQGQYGGEQHGPPPNQKAPEEYAPEDMSWEESRSMGGYGGPDSKKRRGVGHNLASVVG
jgi:hypothetical protein